MSAAAGLGLGSLLRERLSARGIASSQPSATCAPLQTKCFRYDGTEGVSPATLAKRAAADEGMVPYPKLAAFIEKAAIDLGIAPAHAQVAGQQTVQAIEDAKVNLAVAEIAAEYARLCEPQVRASVRDELSFSKVKPSVTRKFEAPAARQKTETTFTMKVEPARASA